MVEKKSNTPISNSAMLNTYTYKKMQVHFEINGANIADVADVTYAA